MYLKLNGSGMAFVNHRRVLDIHLSDVVLTNNKTNEHCMYTLF